MLCQSATAEDTNFQSILNSSNECQSFFGFVSAENKSPARCAFLTSGAVVEFTAALLSLHTHSVLQNHVSRATAALTAPGCVQALCVTMEIFTGARAWLPARPLLLTTFAV